MSVRITGKDNIAMYQLIVLKGALKLECLGMKRKGESAYAAAKRVYGLKGNKAAVLKQLESMVEELLKNC